MAAKSKTIRKVAETIARIGKDHANPKSLYRRVREAHPEASKKEIAVAALTAAMLASSRAGDAG
jgi:uncharacterized protein (UPF0147 family)